MGRISLEKGACTDYNVIITSDFELRDWGGCRECGARAEIICGFLA